MVLNGSALHFFDTELNFRDIINVFGRELELISDPE